MDFLLPLEQAVSFVVSHQSAKPSSDVLVRSLLEAEKTAKKTKLSYCPEQLAQTWQLCFITGTQKAQKQGRILLRSGRYLPKWAKIELTYRRPQADGLGDIGTLENCIRLGSFRVILTGPAKFLTRKNILCFDFTRMAVKLGAMTLYQGYIRGGQNTEEHFNLESIKKQAFFAFFLIQDSLIAARGRGGGLALWGRLM